MKNFEGSAVAAKPENSAPVQKAAQEIVSTLGPGLLVTGNVVCTGSVQIFGRVIGDIHAARLLICKGADVQGTVMAQEAVIEGEFKGTIHSNSVKLQTTAVVEGEIFKQSLVIEQNAQFEGVARRLATPVEVPTAEQIKGKAPIVVLAAKPVERPNTAQQASGSNGNGTQTFGISGGAAAGQPFHDGAANTNGTAGTPN
jgi:cytoskeletal protein CcmA (bactofilin family)